jgi:hypothetical protein
MMRDTLKTLSLIAMLFPCGCDQSPTSAMAGQSNATITFLGKAVDQDGKPLAGARFEFELEAYPKGWSFESRGKANDKSAVTATSDSNGLFRITVTGCTLRRSRAEREGYRHFYDNDRHGSAINNYYYTFISWGNLWYKSDPANPAVFVFVKDGIREVSALPCKGGSDSANGKEWTVNTPGWPKQPSLEDVVQKQPTTSDQ